MIKNVSEVFWVFLRLGFTSFGGPVAHLGYFHDEFVKKRKWLNESSYSDLVALCQFLPGPASSQVGMAIGLLRAGKLGSVAAWLAFTAPSAILLVLFSLGITKFENIFNHSVLHGLKIVAVAVVAQALLAMGKNLSPDKTRATLAVIVAVFALILPTAFTQIACILGGGLYGIFYLRKVAELPHNPVRYRITKKFGSLLLGLFFLILFGFPVIEKLLHKISVDINSIQLFDSFFRAGSLVFGGGHVVLPLLQAEVVPTGWLSQDLFMAGYGVSQAIPGPLFSFSAFLGASVSIAPSVWWGAGLCLIAIFLPSFLLILGVLPFWEKLSTYKQVRFAMLGVNAAVVGLLLAAFYNPVWTSAIKSPKDFCFAMVGFILLVFWKTPSWLVVLLGAVASGLFL